MANGSVLQSDLIASVRQHADQENNPFMTDAVLKSWITRSARELYDLLIRTLGEDYYLSTAIITTVPTLSGYSLASDFYKLVGVSAQYTSGLWQALEPFNRYDVDALLNATSGAGVGGGAGIPRYRLRGQQAFLDRFGGASPSLASLELLPIPQTVYQVRYEYIPTFVAVTDGTTGAVTYDGINGWEEWIIWDVVAKVNAKGNEDPSFALAQRGAEEQRIRDLAGSRDRAQPERVVDVRRELDAFESPLLPSARWGWR